MALIPEISKYLAKHNHKLVKKRLKEAFIFALIIGIGFTSVIYLFRYPLLSFLYNDVSAANYIKYLSPFFILFYLEAIFSSFMQAINKNKVTLKITIIGSVIKLVSIFIFAFLNIGVYCLLIAEILNIIIVVLLNFLYTKKYFNSLG